MRQFIFIIPAELAIVSPASAAVVTKSVTLQPASASIVRSVTTDEITITSDYLAWPLGLPSEKLVKGNTYQFQFRFPPNQAMDLNASYGVFDMHLSFGNMPTGFWQWIANATTTGSTVQLYGSNVVAPYQLRTIDEYLTTASSGTVAIDFNEWRGQTYIKLDQSKPIRLTGIDLTVLVSSGLLDVPQMDLSTAKLEVGGFDYSLVTAHAATMVAVPEPAAGVGLGMLVVMSGRRVTKLQRS